MILGCLFLSSIRLSVGTTNSLKVNNFEMKILIFCRATLLIIHAAAVRTSGRRRWTRIERVQSNLLVRFSERTFDLATGDFDWSDSICLPFLVPLIYITSIFISVRHQQSVLHFSFYINSSCNLALLSPHWRVRNNLIRHFEALAACTLRTSDRSFAFC